MHDLHLEYNAQVSTKDQALPVLSLYKKKKKKKKKTNWLLQVITIKMANNAQTENRMHIDRCDCIRNYQRVYMKPFLEPIFSSWD